MFLFNWTQNQLKPNNPLFTFSYMPFSAYKTAQKNQLHAVFCTAVYKTAQKKVLLSLFLPCESKTVLKSFQALNLAYAFATNLPPNSTFFVCFKGVRLQDGPVQRGRSWPATNPVRAGNQLSQA